MIPSELLKAPLYWTKGNYKDIRKPGLEHCYCLVGAIRQCRNGSTFMNNASADTTPYILKVAGVLLKKSDEELLVSVKASTEATIDLMRKSYTRLIASDLSDESGDREMLEALLIGFNDAPDTTWQMVVSVLREAKL